MTSPASKLRVRLKLCVVLGTAAIIVISAPRIVDAQGLVQGVQQGAREGNKAAGPIGGVLGGAIGGVVGAVGGVVCAVTGGNSNQKGAPAQPAAKDAGKADGSKSDASKSKTAKAAKGQKQTAVLT